MLLWHAVTPRLPMDPLPSCRITMFARRRSPVRRTARGLRPLGMAAPARPLIACSSPWTRSPCRCRSPAHHGAAYISAVSRSTQACCGPIDSQGWGRSTALQKPHPPCSKARASGPDTCWSAHRCSPIAGIAASSAHPDVHPLLEVALRCAAHLPLQRPAPDAMYAIEVLFIILRPRAVCIRECPAVGCLLCPAVTEQAC